MGWVDGWVGACVEICLMWLFGGGVHSIFRSIILSLFFSIIVFFFIFLFVCLYLFFTLLSSFSFSVGLYFGGLSSFFFGFGDFFMGETILPPRPNERRVLPDKSALIVLVGGPMGGGHSLGLEFGIPHGSKAHTCKKGYYGRKREGKGRGLVVFPASARLRRN